MEEPSSIDPRASTRAHAGGLTASFVDGDLRDVRWHGSQVIQRVYMAVRDRMWNTIPATLSNTTLVQTQTRFAIEFDAVNQYGEIDLDWHGRIEGLADGSLSYTWSGRAVRAFEYCKIGLNLHHARDPYLDTPFTIRTRQGLVSGTFDADIVPQLVRDGSLTAMTDYFDQLTVSIGGADATFDFDGDPFELQDHRNWADANWKSYGTPLSFGFPMTIAADEHLEQGVRMSVAGSGVAAWDDTAPVSWWLDPSSVSSMPRIGHLWNEVVGDEPAAQLRRLRPDHLRVDIHPGPEVAGAVQDVSRLCAELGCHLEVAAFVRPQSAAADAADFAKALAQTSISVDRVLVLQESGGFSEFGGAAPTAMAEAVRQALSDADIEVGSIVSGTPQSFNDLNRDRPDYSAIDGLVFALNPQVHAADDDSLMQNTKAIPDIVNYARRVFGDVEVALSPVDLIGANGPYPAGPMAPQGRAVNEDPRQWTAFGAAWTLAALAEMARCRTTSATLFELSGPRGLVDGTKTSSVFGLFSDLAVINEWSPIAAGSSAPERLAVLAFHHGDVARAALANLTSEPLTVTHPGAGRGSTEILEPYGVVWRDVDAVGLKEWSR